MCVSLELRGYLGSEEVHLERVDGKENRVDQIVQGGKNERRKECGVSQKHSGKK